MEPLLLEWIPIKMCDSLSYEKRPTRTHKVRRRQGGEVGQLQYHVTLTPLAVSPPVVLLSFLVDLSSAADYVCDKLVPYM